jgi:acetylornithine deacetylase
MFRVWEVLREWIFLLQKQICSVSGSAPIVNIAQVKGGEAINIVSEHAEIHLGIRPMPEHNIQQLLKPLYEGLAPLQKQIGRLSGKIWIEEVQHAHPLLTKLPTPLEKAIRQEHSSAKAIGVPFATDGGAFAQMGFQPIICGPGSIDLAHQPNEFIEISEMLQYEKLLGSLLHKWCF